MCCARVCRCRAACCAQGGAGKAHRPDRRRRARRDFPRSAKAAYSYVSERSRAATAPGRGDPREPAYFVVDEHWSVEHRTPVQLSAVEPVCRSAGGPRAPGREGNTFPVRTRIPVRRGGGPAAVGPHPPGGPLSASPASGFGSNATRQHRSGAAGPERGRERGAPRSPSTFVS